MPTSPIVFVKEARDELKKVTWPSRSEIIRLSVAVLIISFGVGIFLGAIDFGLTKILETILNK